MPPPVECSPTLSARLHYLRTNQRFSSPSSRSRVRVHRLFPVHSAQHFRVIPRRHIRHDLQDRQDFVLDRREHLSRLELRQRSALRLAQRRRISRQEEEAQALFLLLRVDAKLLFFLLFHHNSAASAIQRRCPRAFAGWSRDVRRGSGDGSRAGVGVERAVSRHRLRPLVDAMESTRMAVCLLFVSIRRLFNARRSPSFGTAGRLGRRSRRENQAQFMVLLL